VALKRKDRHTSTPDHLWAKKTADVWIFKGRSLSLMLLTRKLTFAISSEKGFGKGDFVSKGKWEKHLGLE
jgi:hypothetical protein